MTHFSRFFGLAILGVFTLGESQAADTKKGIGLAESEGFGDSQLQDLNVAWYYNWSLQSQIKTHVPFVPMAFSIASIAKLPRPARETRPLYARAG